MTENNKNDEEGEVIDMTDRQQVGIWTTRLDVTTVQLNAAINAVGNLSVNVKNYLDKKQKRSMK